MQFLVSWLAEYVELSDLLPIVQDGSGRRGFGALDAGAERALRELGARLTSVGLAVEGVPLHVFADGGREPLLEIEVTSNRPDCMNHLGLAREIAALLGRPLRRPNFELVEVEDTTARCAAIAIEEAEGCPRYVARVIRGLRVGPSPAWLRRRLEAIGSRSINNVVDVTNFVLWELGQPLHAFDLATIPDGQVRIRRARADESLVTLDGRERALATEVLVIADLERPIALAGIMGGAATEVTEATRDVLLESAHFDRRWVRRAAKRLGMHTDASHRFERGADYGIAEEASRRAAALLAEVAGGEVLGEGIDVIGQAPEGVAWRFDRRRLVEFVGVEIPATDVGRILSALEFAPSEVAPETWAGAVPTFRFADFEPRRGPIATRPPMAYPQDLYEEVLRQFGLDRVPAALPAIGGIDPGQSPAHERRGALRRLFVGCGFAEGIHFAFHDRISDRALPSILREGEPLALANPLSERYSVLRRSLVPNLVAAAEFNVRRGAAEVRLFEIGHLFPGDGTDELEALAWIAGGAPETPWERIPPVDFGEMRGLVDLLSARVAGGIEAVPADLPGLVDGASARLLSGAGVEVGFLGQLDRPDLPVALFVAEVAVDRLEEVSGSGRIVPPPRLPGVALDLTLTHRLETAWRDLARAIEALRPGILAGYRLKDRYQGAGVPDGAVATTFAFDYRDAERTLTQEEVQAAHAVLAESLERRFGIARES